MAAVAAHKLRIGKKYRAANPVEKRPGSDSTTGSESGNEALSSFDSGSESDPIVTFDLASRLEIPGLDNDSQIVHFCWFGSFGENVSAAETNGMNARVGAAAAAHHIAEKERSEGPGTSNVKVVVWLYDHDVEYLIFQNPGSAVSEFEKLKEKYLGVFMPEVRKHIEVRRVVNAIDVAAQHPCLSQCKRCVSQGTVGCANCKNENVLSPDCNYRKMLDSTLSWVFKYSNARNHCMAKDLFTLLLLWLFGGWTLDSTVVLQEGSPILDATSKIWGRSTVPHMQVCNTLPDGVEMQPDLSGEGPDVFMMVAPSQCPLLYYCMGLVFNNELEARFSVDQGRLYDGFVVLVIRRMVYNQGMERMTPDERDALQEAMRELYAVHYTELMERSEGVDEANSGGGSMAGNQGDPDNPDTDPANEW